jgi:hypothetical protein
MTFGKFATIVILLACTLLTSLNPVNGGCTEQDKNEILNLCKDNVKRGAPVVTLPLDCPCCVKAKKGQGHAVHPPMDDISREEDIR